MTCVQETEDRTEERGEKNPQDDSESKFQGQRKHHKVQIGEQEQKTSGESVPGNWFHVWPF